VAGEAAESVAALGTRLALVRDSAVARVDGFRQRPDAAGRAVLEIRANGEPTPATLTAGSTWRAASALIASSRWTAAR